MTAQPTTQALASFPVSPVLSVPVFAGSPTSAGAANFVDRRSGVGKAASTERRQFTNSHAKLSPEARELAEAIDQYKADNRRRFITFEEMLQVITQLGYHRQS